MHRLGPPLASSFCSLTQGLNPLGTPHNRVRTCKSRPAVRKVRMTSPPQPELPMRCRRPLRTSWHLNHKHPPRSPTCRTQHRRQRTACRHMDMPLLSLDSSQAMQPPLLTVRERKRGHRKGCP